MIVQCSPTIGVFDSGFGGLTVLRALLPLIPAARYIYLGDTARLPYGSKSQQTVARYAVSSARFLHEQGADILVVACNTATALALDDIPRGAADTRCRRHPTGCPSRCRSDPANKLSPSAK